ncbi:MAG: ribbon-helix-helix domain-containing protein [Nanobdellota archaeon]
MKKRMLNREKISVTIDKKILKKFNDYCDENSINKSQLLEKQIIKYLKEVGICQE